MILMRRRDCRPLSLRRAADLLQALGHPIRLQLLHALWSSPRTVSQLVDRLGLEQPVVSRHLTVLREAGVLAVEPSGRERIYRLAGAHVAPLLEILFASPTRTETGAHA
jgi:ArsR family transcriptional regulator